MANSRLEKIGTIYTRSKGLLQSGAVAWADRPLWYDIYEAFPPKEEPRFDRPVPKLPIKEIFYKEDKIRALLHDRIKHIGVVNLANSQTKTFTQRFISTYQKLEQQYEGSEVSTEKMFEETLEMLNREREAKGEEGGDENINLSSAFLDAQKKQDKAIGINVKDIFKE